jgi:hypothetical protein
MLRNSDDGFEDIISSTKAASSGADKTFVVFSKANWTSSPLSLSTLNGANEFELGAVLARDNADISVAQAGVNQDRIDDIIIGGVLADLEGLSYTSPTIVAINKE